MKAPCINCPKVGCGSYHDICPEYQEFRKAKEKEYAERKKRSGEYHDKDQVVQNRMNRVK